MKLLIFLHRWLGIPTCLFFLIWFSSGIVMMYAEMPALSEQQRFSALPVLDSRAQLSAAAAIDLAELPGYSYMKLTSLFGRPVWRIRGQEGRWTTVFADTGDVREAFQYEEASRSVVPFAATGVRPRLIEALDQPDQWTVGGNYARLRPLYHIALDDAPRTELYIASATGEVILRSTAKTRMLAWAGAIPHWLYLTAIRRHGPFWRQLVIWASGIGCVVALLGMAVGVLRASPSRRYSLKDKRRTWSPYFGMMRWHHWVGLSFGLVTFTWVFSGLLSMDPGYVSTGRAPSEAQAAAFSGPELDYRVFDAKPAQLLACCPQAREIELHQVAAKPYYLLASSPVGKQLTDAEGNLVPPFSGGFLVAAARAAVPKGHIVQQTSLNEYDAYYYDREWRAPLPVWRIKFDDPAHTWLYIDPARAAILARYERAGRVERWLYNGFHSWDFPFLWSRRPAWDIVVIALSLGGILLSVTGVVIGYRRLRSSVVRTHT
jgi:hypothetical protein